MVKGRLGPSLPYRLWLPLGRGLKALGVLARLRVQRGLTDLLEAFQGHPEQVSSVQELSVSSAALAEYPASST